MEQPSEILPQNMRFLLSCRKEVFTVKILPFSYLLSLFKMHRYANKHGILIKRKKLNFNIKIWHREQLKDIGNTDVPISEI